MTMKQPRGGFPVGSYRVEIHYGEQVNDISLLTLVRFKVLPAAPTSTAPLPHRLHEIILWRRSVTVRPARLSDLETLVRFSAAMAEETEGRTLDLERLRQGTAGGVGVIGDTGIIWWRKYVAGRCAVIDHI